MINVLILEKIIYNNMKFHAQKLLEITYYLMLKILLKISVDELIYLKFCFKKMSFINSELIKKNIFTFKIINNSIIIHLLINTYSTLFKSSMILFLLYWEKYAFIYPYPYPFI